MAKKSIDQIYTILFNMRDALNKLEQDSNSLLGATTEYGGEISRIFNEQLKKYFIPEVKKLADEKEQPGSIIGLIKFLDSVPLSMTRPDPEKMYPAVENSGEDSLDTPVGSTAPSDYVEDPNVTNAPVTNGMAPGTYQPSEVDQLPLNMSYNTQKQNESVKKKDNQPLKEKQTLYSVVRKTNRQNPITNKPLPDQIIREFKTKEEAENLLNYMNTSITESERSFLGTSYELIEREI